MIKNQLFTLLLSALFWTTNAHGEPLHRTEGPITGFEPIQGYTTDSLRNHSVNNYWILGETGIVVIDAHWRISEGERAASHMRTKSQLPVTELIVTHPHGDHYGGLPAFYSENVTTLIMSSIAWRGVRHDEQGFQANRLDEFGDDFPRSFPTEGRVAPANGRLKLQGIEFEFEALRGNEAIESLVIRIPKEGAVFTGDIVNSKTHPVFYQGGLDLWIEQLRRLRKTVSKDDTIFPGHGEPGPARYLVTEQLRYLETFRGLIDGALEQGSTLAPSTRQHIVDRMVEEFPDWRTTAGIATRAQVIELNIDWTLQAYRVAGVERSDPRSFRPD